MHQQQPSCSAGIEAAIGHAVNTQEEYDFALNGFSARLTAAQAATISSLPGVTFVRANETLRTRTDESPAALPRSR